MAARVQESNQKIIDDRHENLTRDRLLLLQARKKAARHKADAQSRNASGSSNRIHAQHKKVRGSTGGKVDERYEKDENGGQGEGPWGKDNTGGRTDSGKGKGKQKSEEENKQEDHSGNPDDEEFLNQLFGPDETLNIYEGTQFMHALRQGLPPAASASSSSSNSG